MVFISNTIFPNVPEQKLKTISITLKVQRFCLLSNPRINKQIVRITGTFLFHLFTPPLQHNCHHWKEAQKIYERHKPWLQVSIIFSVELIAKVWIMSTFIYIKKNYWSILSPMRYTKHQRIPKWYIQAKGQKWWETCERVQPVNNMPLKKSASVHLIHICTTPEALRGSHTVSIRP